MNRFINIRPKLPFNFNKSRFFNSTVKHLQSKTFQDLGIISQLSKNLASIGITKPTELQTAIIEKINEEKELLIKDVTGSGKSFVTLLGVLNKTRLSKEKSAAGVEVLILVPTREMVKQLHTWSRKILGENFDPKAVQGVFKDQTTEKAQLETLQTSTPKVLIATPTIVSELIENRSLSLELVSTVVLDEADQMLKLPNRFAPSAKRKNRERHPTPCQLILNELSKNSELPKLIVISASLNLKLRDHFRRNGLMMQPQFIDNVQTNANKMPSSLSHYCCLINQERISNLDLSVAEEPFNPLTSTNQQNRKEIDLDLLLDAVNVIIKLEQITKSIVFLNYQLASTKIMNLLEFMGYEVVNLEQYYSIEKYQMSRSIEDKPLIVVANSNEARGLDISDLEAVFMLGLANSVADYVHMAGRCSRINSKFEGKVITLIDEKEGNEFKKAKQLYGYLNVEIKKYSHIEEYVVNEN